MALEPERQMQVSDSTIVKPVPSSGTGTIRKRFTP
jgi:hypothetical protein